MESTLPPEAMELLPFWVTAPSENDTFMLIVGVTLILILWGFGALYFTIQTLPDRMGAGAHKVQIQLVSVLGLISLFTMNNAFWIAGILIAAVPLHELFPSLKPEASTEGSDD